MKLRVGVIGTGAIAKYRHLPEYAAREDVEIVALCDIIKEKADKLAVRYGVESVYTDYKQMIENEELDAVSVCTPNYLHAEISIFALNHGLHVLVEKPMATSLDEANAMIEAAKKQERVLMVGQNQRLAPMHVLAKRSLKAVCWAKSTRSELSSVTQDQSTGAKQANGSSTKSRLLPVPWQTLAFTKWTLFNSY